MAKRTEVIVERDSGATSVAVMEVIDNLSAISAAPQAAASAAQSADVANQARADAHAAAQAASGSADTAAIQSSSAGQAATQAGASAGQAGASASAAAASATSAEASATRVDLGALDDAVAATGADRNAALAHAQEAQTQAGAAATARTDAQTAEAESKLARDAAVVARGDAIAAQTASAGSAAQAEASAATAGNLAAEALESRNAAYASRGAAVAAATGAEAALNAAVIAEGSAVAAQAAAEAAKVATEEVAYQVGNDASELRQEIDAQVSAIGQEVSAPREVAPSEGVNWFWFDSLSRAIGGWSDTGLRVPLDDWTVQGTFARIRQNFFPDGDIDGESIEASAGIRILWRDADENALLLFRNAPGDQGLDAIFSKSFWDRGATALFNDDFWTLARASLFTPDFWDEVAIVGGGEPVNPGVSTTAIQIITVQGQSLSVGGGWDTMLPRSAALAWQASNAAGHAYMIAGLVANNGSDPSNVAITDTLGPRSRRYVETVLGTGLVAAPPAPSASSIGAPWPLANLANLHRADLGLPMVPVLTTAHGIAGVRIEDIDGDPATGSGATTIWDNMVFWYSEAIRLAAAAGKSVTVPFHDWVHGTSASGDQAGVYLGNLWKYRRDFLAMLQNLGVTGQTLMLLSQPGGNANTTNAGHRWFVVDEMLDFCEAGGGIMVTPEYAYQIADNNVHPDAYWTAQFEEVKAWAIAEIEAGRQWQILRPKATIAGNVVTLDFGLRPDEYFVLHESARYNGQGIDQFAGFQADGATITAMELFGNRVVLTCSSPPSAITYARQKQDVTGFAGNVWNAHRGLLRTSLTKPSKFLDGVTLYRWVPTFRVYL